MRISDFGPAEWAAVYRETSPYYGRAHIVSLGIGDILRRTAAFAAVILSAVTRSGEQVFPQVWVILPPTQAADSERFRAELHAATIRMTADELARDLSSEEQDVIRKAVVVMTTATLDADALLQSLEGIPEHGATIVTECALYRAQDEPVELLRGVVSDWVYHVRHLAQGCVAIGRHHGTYFALDNGEFSP